MRKSSIIFLQVVIVLIGIGTLAFLLWEPHLEGRNVGAMLYEIYFKDAFLAYVYIASIAFFTALYKVFKVLGYMRDNKTFSQQTLKAVRTIKYCGTILVAFVLGAEGYLFVVRPGDDIAGGVFMGLLAIVVCGTIAIVAARFEKVLQNNTTA